MRSGDEPANAVDTALEHACNNKSTRICKYDRYGPRARLQQQQHTHLQMRSMQPSNTPTTTRVHAPANAVHTALEHACNNKSTRSCSTRECSASASLPHDHLDVATTDDLHKFGIRLCREDRACLKLRSDHAEVDISNLRKPEKFSERMTCSVVQ